MYIAKSLYRFGRQPALAAGYQPSTSFDLPDAEPRESVVPKKKAVKAMMAGNSLSEVEVILRKVRSREPLELEDLPLRPVLAAAANDPGTDADARDQSNGLSLAKLLKVGALCTAVACLETLSFFVTGYPEMGVLNPFAAMMLLLASPFFYWMGRLARY